MSAPKKPLREIGEDTARNPAPVLRYADLEPSEPEESESELTATMVGIPAIAPVAQSRHPYVIMIAGPRPGETIKIAKPEVFIGRGAQCDVRIDGDGVSRRHARIFQMRGDYFIEDMQSTNGTWIGDEKIDRAVQLRDNDRIQVGNDTLIRFKILDDLEAQMQQQLFDNAMRDPLTKAFNRKYFTERFRSEIGHALRHQSSLSLILLDIDFFKRVNDTYGHPAGDAVLKAVCTGISATIRTEDVFARVGGEEFCLIVRGIDMPKVVQFAERLRLLVSNLNVPYQNVNLQISASFGVASIDEIAMVSPADPNVADTDRLFALTDHRLYRAKQSGRNRVVYD